MPTLETLVGLVAALCTTASYLPQVVKAWRTRSTGDLSLKMMLLLFAGLSLWVLYGFLQGDAVIILANVVSLALLANLIVFKAKELAAARRPDRAGGAQDGVHAHGRGGGMAEAERTA